MAEWLYEAGIGEARAALVEDGAIVAARIELDDGAPRAGARLTGRLADAREGRVTLDRGGEVQLNGPARGVTQGATLTVEIAREAIPEPGRAKLPRALPTDEPPREAPDLLAQLGASGVPVRRLLAHQPDALEQAGWSELLDEALSGEIVFARGALRMTPTPAMVLFDVDGEPPLEPLAIAAATAVARAIRRHDIGGSIGVDFPTIAGKAARQAIGEAIDAVLPPPFERTALNGFGFLQIVRRRSRASIPELLRADPAGAAARALLRAIERTPPPVPQVHRVGTRVHAALAAHPSWVAEASRRAGTALTFEPS
ncbi:MAG: ribonuclease [Sphingomonas sp.]|uniref:ribonuclease n=1 Tax=Sphingomonas sp. TaxID=28214 RepID=UPI003562A96D